MTILLPPKKLLIPNKTMQQIVQPGYGTDMRAIEQYINSLAPGGVTQIIAGTDITVDPTDGLGAVTINSTGGGGGGGAPSQVLLQAACDFNDYPYTFFP